MFSRARALALSTILILSIQSPAMAASGQAVAGISETLLQLATARDGSSPDILFSDSKTLEPVKGLDVRAGDGVVVDVVVDADEIGFLTVFAADMDGVVVVLFPRSDTPEVEIPDLDSMTLANGRKHIRVAFPKAQASKENLSLQLGSDSCAPVFVTAVLSEEPLFEQREMVREWSDFEQQLLSRLLKVAVNHLVVRSFGQPTPSG